jgi:lysophospholipase L1-like esterase
VLLHELIANLILFEITNRGLEQAGIGMRPEFLDPIASCPLPSHDGGGGDLPGYDPDAPGAEKPFYLRIMPLGASITAGVGTDPQNGYRKPLRDQLRWKGWPVNMIGSQADGDPEKFHDRQHEGHPGWVVANMTKAADMSIDQKPNLILINCGTNDANPGNDQDVATTATRMEGLLNYLYSQVDGVTIILSTLLPYLEDTPNRNVNIINPGYRDLYQRFRQAGKKIGLAELNNGLLDTSTDYHDHIHPNEKGAAKVAAVWAKAIAEVEQAGFLTEPINTGQPDNSTAQCDVERGQGRGPVRTQQGWGEDDGPYVHRQDRTIGGSLESPLAPNGFFSVGTKVSFAQLVNLGGADPGGEFDELIYCYDLGTDDDPTFGNCLMILNDGGDLSGKEIVIDVGLKCLTRGQRWGDVNGDGLDDFICIGPDGNMYVSINRGGNPPKFEPLENGGPVKKGYSWAAQDRIRLGDIDGDGRLDYCAIDDKGDIYCWRNGGVGDAPTADHDGYWQSFVRWPNSGALIELVLTLPTSF